MALGFILAAFCANVRAADETVSAIVCPHGAPANVNLAAQELRRYVYVRTGQLLPVTETGSGFTLKIDPALGPQAYRIGPDGITGGDDVGVLYGAYRYAERLGVRFYLHGDVVPDVKLKALPVVNDAGKPLFELRGIQPFHDFPEGPDWWNRDDYLAYVAQLPKLRMNFIGLHCYPDDSDSPGDKHGPEPLVWIGPSHDIKANGDVSSSYPAQWASTERPGLWGYAPEKTSAFSGGASLLFPSDTYASDMMAGLTPRPQTPEDCNALFDHVGRELHTIFAEAKSLGIKTCIGTETPLTIPVPLRARSPDVRALYTGMFKRIAAACPVDYYWLWTPEWWSLHGNTPQQFEAASRDIHTALDALHDAGDPFTLALSGWVLGPAHDRSAFDHELPKNCPISCINRHAGNEGVEPGFATITDRPKWANPWAENDPNLVGPQLWAARMRYDAVDARRFGCTGLFVDLWRTKAIAPNIAALAAAAWDQSWVPANFDRTHPLPSKSSEGAVGGEADHGNGEIRNAGDTPAPVYQSVRSGMQRYTLAVPEGTYGVTLQFVEPRYTEAGQRVFGVKIQGKPVLEHLDIFARAGKNTALELSFPAIAVSTGTLSIEFTPETGTPCIAGIVLRGQIRAMNQFASTSVTRKINCGGPAVADYEADRVGSVGTPAAPRDRAMPIEDFYVDFARANFGDAIAESAGRIFARIDGVHLPQTTFWLQGPGALRPNAQPWAEVKKQYAFVDELAALRPRIDGSGNLDRFDYWLGTFRAMRVMAEACCVRGQLDAAMAAKKYEPALAARIELARVWTRLLTLQVEIVSTPGELGTIANLEQHTEQKDRFLTGQDAALVKALGHPLPPETLPGKDYTGPSKIVVLTVRGLLRPGETLKLPVIVLDRALAKNVTLHFRPMGQGDWQEKPVNHVGRAVYAVEVPAVAESLEYYLTAQTAAGLNLVWPATAPQLNQTVVVTPP